MFCGPVAFGVDYIHQTRFKVIDNRDILRTAMPNEIRDPRTGAPIQVRDDANDKPLTFTDPATGQSLAPLHPRRPPTLHQTPRPRRRNRHTLLHARRHAQPHRHHRLHFNRKNRDEDEEEGAAK